MQIDLGIDFETAEKEVAESRKPVAIGDYSIQVTDIKPGVGGESSKNPGRPLLNWELSIIGHPDYTGKKLFYNTSLPWADPSNGNRLLTSGLNFLTDLTKALGHPWAGRAIQTEQYIGLTCHVTVGHTINKKTGEPQAVVDKVYA